MPLSSIFQKASHLLLKTNNMDELFSYENNEVLYCKNNICVHPPKLHQNEFETVHYPGYLSVTAKVFTDQHNSARRPTLFMNWIPNVILKKVSITKQSNREKTAADYENQGGVSEIISPRSSLKNQFFTQSNECPCDLSDHAFSISDNSDSNSDKISIKSSGSKSCETPQYKLDKPSDGRSEMHVRSQSMSSMNITIANPFIENVIIASVRNSDKFVRSLSMNSCDEAVHPNWMNNPELSNLKQTSLSHDTDTHSVSVVKRYSRNCRRFSVDLSQMRSLRLFFNDEECTCGQLVVASRESQYKILHFHHGGLDRLAQVLHNWHALLHNIKMPPGLEEISLPFRHFMVTRPEVQKSEQHPEEGRVAKISTEHFYKTILNCKGQIEDDLFLRKSVFFGGLENELRHAVWPFLLHCYPFNSTFDERVVLIDLRKREYDGITKKRLEMLPEESDNFYKTVQSVVEKDVVRTDRGNPFFAGDDNENIELMKKILLNYAAYNPLIGYTQGMSDLLAPILSEIKEEVETFWCFVGLMQKTIFVCTPTDNDVDNCLEYLRELVRIMLPHFYNHLKNNEDAMELLFCHRWILLCFKREFPESVALRIWEACWSNYLTDYFNLFICLAIIAVYADDVIAQGLRTDEMLLYFNSLAFYMDGNLILCKARGLLHQYRQLSRIPCTLAGLCQKCGPGIWDSTHNPAVECVGHVTQCPFILRRS